MGKRRKRLTMAKYAKKYALKREKLGFNTRGVENKLIEIDMNTSEEIKEEEQVQVVVNKPIEEKESTPPWEPQPELELLQVEEPEVQEIAPPPKKKPTRRKRTTTKTTTSTRKTPARRTTKKTEK